MLACPFGIVPEVLASGWCRGLADHGGWPAGRLGGASLPPLAAATSCCHRMSLVIALLTHGGIHSEVFETSEFAEVFLKFGVNVQVFGFGIFQEGPELLQPIELAGFIVLHGFLLKILEYVQPELLFQAITVVSKKALQTISVAFFGILQSQLLELFIHFFVEVISEEEGPEAEESVHLLRLADAQAFPLVKAAPTVLVVDVLCEAVFLEQLMGRMLEFGQ